MRSRAVLRGTVGKRIAGTSKPASMSALAAESVASLDPRMWGMIGILESPDVRVLMFSRSFWRSAVPSVERMICSEVIAALAIAGGGAVE